MSWNSFIEASQTSDAGDFSKNCPPLVVINHLYLEPPSGLRVQRQADPQGYHRPHTDRGPAIVSAVFGNTSPAKRFTSIPIVAGYLADRIKSIW